MATFSRMLIGFLLNMMKFALLVAAIQTASIGVAAANAQVFHDQLIIVVCIIGASATETFRELFAIAISAEDLQMTAPKPPLAQTSKQYLGDGVYADIVDGFMLLTAEDGVSATDSIYLDLSVIAALEDYIKKTIRGEQA